MRYNLVVYIFESRSRLQVVALAEFLENSITNSTQDCLCTTNVLLIPWASTKLQQCPRPVAIQWRSCWVWLAFTFPPVITWSHVLRDISTYPLPIYFVLHSRAFPPAKLTCLTDRRYYLRWYISPTIFQPCYLISSLTTHVSLRSTYILRLRLQTPQSYSHLLWQLRYVRFTLFLLSLQAYILPVVSLCSTGINISVVFSPTVTTESLFVLQIVNPLDITLEYITLRSSFGGITFPGLVRINQWYIRLHITASANLQKTFCLFGLFRLPTSQQVSRNLESFA